MTWNAANDAGGIKEYRVYYSEGSLIGKTFSRTDTYPLDYNSTGQIIYMSSAVTSGTSFDVSALSEDTLYYFVVHAIDNSDNEDNNTAQQNYRMPFFTPPSPPTNLAFVSGAGPTTNRTPFISGDSFAGYTVKLFVDSVLYNTQAINSTGAFSIQLSSLPNTTGNYVITASHVNPSGLEGPTATVGTYQLQINTPTATLTGAPANNATTGDTELNITVGGTYANQYRYSLMHNQTTSCQFAVYTAWIAIATPITDNLSADSAKRLCVVAKSSAGLEQDVAAATQVDWTKNTTPPPAPSITSLTNPITNSTTLTHTPLVAVTLSDVTEAAYYCVKSGLTAPTVTAGDACWNASKPTTVTLPDPAVRTATTYNVYAWSKNSFGTISSTPNSASISYFKPCDTGNLSTTCDLIGAWSLSSETTIGGQGTFRMLPGSSITGVALQRHVFTFTGDFTMYASTNITANIDVTAANITLSTGSTINADGLGFQGNVGALGDGDGGGAPSTASYQAGGGSHGGLGSPPIFAGTTHTDVYSFVGTTYGSASAPVTFGSAGGGGNNNANTTTFAGTAGGGAVRLTSSGVVTLSGSISADANDTNENGQSRYATGAGGSIFITAGSLAGAGTLQAEGGGSVQNFSGGYGGGGRIAIVSANPFEGAVSVAGGMLGTNSTHYRNFNSFGESGSFYTNYTNICTTGSLSTTCTISKNISISHGTNISGSGNLVIASGGSLRLLYPMRTMSISMGGDITVQNGGSILGNLTNFEGANITIDSGGVVSAKGFGYTAKGTTSQTIYGAGLPYWSGCSDNYYNGGGGSHGGVGGRPLNSRGRPDPSSSLFHCEGWGSEEIYGSRTNPVSFGGPGGNAINTYGIYALGATGGGAILVQTAGTLTVNGSLNADGNDGLLKLSNVSGAGAGGGLKIVASSLAGSGSISANGGNGAVSSTPYESGGGGGGRIAIQSASRFNGTIRVNGGAAGGSSSTAGGPGTVDFSNADQICSSGTLASTCVISGKYRLQNGSTFTANNLTIANGGELSALRGDIVGLNISGTLLIQNGGRIFANVAPLTANNLTIDSGGALVADALGHFSYRSYNPLVSGSGRVHSSTCSGGAYGGDGGLTTYGTTYGAAAVAFGSSTNPVSFGGPGGGCTYSSGGDSGGKFLINVSGVTTVNGTISSKGGDAARLTAANGGGGGAGGAINITTGTLAGVGLLQSNGGLSSNAAGTNIGGGGAGGRIAVTRSVNSWSGTTSVTGGGCYNGCSGSSTGGGSGTVVFQ